MKFERRINYYETDKMTFVHHSNYIRFFEEARVYLLDKFGLNYAYLEKRGIMIPVLDIEVKYRKYLSFDDTIVIDTKIKSFNGVKMTVGYEVFNKADGTLATTGQSTHCFIDGQTHKPINMKRSYPEIYETLKKIESELN